MWLFYILLNEIYIFIWFLKGNQISQRLVTPTRPSTNKSYCSLERRPLWFFWVTAVLFNSLKPNIQSYSKIIYKRFHDLHIVSAQS